MFEGLNQSVYRERDSHPRPPPPNIHTHPHTDRQKTACDCAVSMVLHYHRFLAAQRRRATAVTKALVHMGEGRTQQKWHLERLQSLIPESN